VNSTDRTRAGQVDAAPTDVDAAWAAQEEVVLAALRRLRDLAAPPGSWAPAAADLGVVDVVRGSAGVWHAFWLHADLQAAPQVCAVIPDLRPLTDVMSGASATEWADLQGLVASGRIGIRLVLPPEAATGVVRAVVDELVAAGVEVRTAEAPTWFFVSSQDVGLVPLDWAGTDDVDAAVVRGGPLPRLLTELFEHRWRAARPLLDQGHHDVLRLLAEGRGDEQVAEALGLSVRTVRRRVAEAMEAYGAATRFELGHRVATAEPR